MKYMHQEKSLTITQDTFRLNDTTQIPVVGFGTYLIDSADAAATVATAIEIGYRHIDTAAAYGNEAEVGKGIARGYKAAGITRADIFVTAKLWPGNPAWGDAPKDGAATAAAFDDSLIKLGIDYADLYLIHAPYGGDLRLMQWRALLDLQSAGKARAIGVSNFNVTHLDEIKDAGLSMPEANQIKLHPWAQKPAFLSYIVANEIAPIAYSSLVPLSTWRTQDGQASAKMDDMKASSAAFASMAAKYGISEAQLLLRWGVQNGFAVLPKSMNADRMRLNIDLSGFEIDAADLALIKTMDLDHGVAWASGDPSLAE